MSRFSTVWRCALMGLMVAVAAGSLVTAQEKKRSRGDSDDRRGPGGFNFRGFVPGKSVMFNSPQVRQELALDEKQSAAIDKIVEEAQEKNRAEFSGFVGFRDLPEAEQQKKLVEFREKSNKLNRETDEQIEKVLNETQNARLNELYLQVRGAEVFDDPSVAKKLDLNDDQKKKVADLITSHADALRSLRAETQNLSREERGKKMEELRAKTEQSLLAVLTDKQKEEWTKMKGKLIDIDRTSVFRGGLRGRGGDSKGKGKN